MAHGELEDGLDHDILQMRKPFGAGKPLAVFEQHRFGSRPPVLHGLAQQCQKRGARRCVRTIGVFGNNGFDTGLEGICGDDLVQLEIGCAHGFPCCGGRRFQCAFSSALRR